MQGLIYAGFIFLSSTGLASLLSTGTTSGPCRAADTWSAETLAWLDSLATRSEAEYSEGRTVFSIAQTTTGEVYLVTDTTVCRRAVQAVDTLLQHSKPERRAYVYQVGSSYAASDPEERAGNRMRIFSFFSANWAYTNGTLRN